VTSFAEALESAFGRDRVHANVRLAPFTTFRVGGPADWLVEPRSAAEIVTTLQLASRSHVPVTLLGGGSNVLVADADEDGGLPDEDQVTPDNQNQKPKNQVDEQLNKALEVLKNRESKA